MNGIEIISPQANFFRKLLFLRSHRHTFPRISRGAMPPPLGGAVKYPAIRHGIISGVRTLRRRTLRRNFTYLRLCGPFVFTDDMIYNYTKSCNKHNPLILWSLLILDIIKILKEACGDTPEARKKKHVIKDRRTIFMIFMYANYIIVLYIKKIEIYKLYRGPQAVGNVSVS